MMQRTQSLINRGPQANYMRATQASKERDGQIQVQNVARQAVLTQWNSFGNVKRYAPIGLITKPKQSFVHQQKR